MTEVTAILNELGIVACSLISVDARLAGSYVDLVLEGLDEVDWSMYGGAYGPCSEAPGVLRRMAHRDPEVAGEGRSEFYSSIWHQGTVYPVTVAVVPFLIELAVTAGVHRRDEILEIIGDLTDPELCDGSDLSALRNAIMAGSTVLQPLMDDAEPSVRAAAAYVIGRCGGPGVGTLLRRWEVETTPVVRAALLLALAHIGAADDDVLAAATGEGDPMPIAAALAYGRAGRPLPPATLAAVAAAIPSAVKWRTPWAQNGALGEIIKRLDGPSFDALTAVLLHTGQQGRLRLAGMLGARFRVSRAAAAASMPRLRTLLADSDAAVVGSAVRSAADTGAAASAVADMLARIAVGGIGPVSEPDSGSPGTGGLPPCPEPADIALATLVRLRDPRWRDPMIAVWEAGYWTQADRLLDNYVPAFDPTALEGVRRRISALLAAGRGLGSVCDAVRLLACWGPDAAPAVPELIAALPVAFGVCSALTAIGPAALPALPALRNVGGIAAGHAIWHLSGDPQSLMTATADFLDHHGWGRYGLELTAAADIGTAAAPLIGRLRSALAARKPASQSEGEACIAAARLLWRATDNPAEALPFVQAILRRDHERAFYARHRAERSADGTQDLPDRSERTDPAVAAAARLAADLAPAATHLAPLLREALDDRLARVAAARALWLHGTEPAALTGPLLDSVTDRFGESKAIALLVDMGASSVVPRLAELAEQDNRIVRSGFYDEIIWEDERLQRQLREAAKILST